MVPDSVLCVKALHSLADSHCAGLDISPATTQTSTSSVSPASERPSRLMDLEAPIKPMLHCNPPRTSQIQTAKHCKIAGMSKDCRHIFFHDEKRVTVLETSLVLKSTPSQAVRVSQIPYSYVEGRQDAVIERVAFSRRWLAICTNQELIILQMGTRPNSAPEMLRRSHGKWEPSGLALYEDDARLLLVLGQRKHEGDSFQGRVLLFHLALPINFGSSMPEPNAYNVPQNDFPKEVDVSIDGTLFLCRTELHNNVVIWELVLEPGSDQRSLTITRRCHTPVSTPTFLLILGKTHKLRLNPYHPGNRTFWSHIHVDFHLAQWTPVPVLHNACLDRTLAKRRRMAFLFAHYLSASLSPRESHPRSRGPKR